MNIADLTNSISAKTGLSKTDAESIVREVFEQISASLKSGEEVKIANFGTFTKKVRAARVGRNPVNGEEIQIPETNQVGFKAAKHLKDSL